MSDAADRIFAGRRRADDWLEGIVRQARAEAETLEDCLGDTDG